MTIQDWGAIGEIVGGLGVIFTLLYLATQIRQNTKHIASASLQAMSERAENRIMSSIANPLFAETLAKAEQGGVLTAAEEIQIRSWLSAWASDLQDAYRQSNLGIIDQKILMGRVKAISQLLRLPGAEEHWEVIKNVADPTYMAWLEGELEKLEST